MLTIDLEHAYHHFTRISHFNATPTQTGLQQIQPPG